MKRFGVARVITETLVNAGCPIFIARRCGVLAKIIIHPIDYSRRKIAAIGAQKLVPSALLEKGFVYLKNEKLEISTSQITKHCEMLYTNKAEKLPNASRMPVPILDYELTDNGPIALDEGFLKPIVSFLSKPEITNIVAGYIGEEPVLGNVSLIWSDISKETIGGKSIHRDMNTAKRMHLILLINDVDEGTGPFTFLPPKRSHEVAKAINYEEHAVEDEVFYEHASEKEMNKFVGKAGDVLFINPYDCFHFGGRCVSSPRLILIVSYTSAYAAKEEFFAWSRMVNRKNICDGSVEQRRLLNL
jgi:hypothetical protein